MPVAGLQGAGEEFLFEEVVGTARVVSRREQALPVHSRWLRQQIQLSGNGSLSLSFFDIESRVSFNRVRFLVRSISLKIGERFSSSSFRVYLCISNFVRGEQCVKQTNETCFSTMFMSSTSIN